MKSEISNRQRPAEHATWDAATGVKKLSVSFSDNPNARQGQIWSNGHNQIGITVQVQMQDSSQHVIRNPSDALQGAIFSALYLVNSANMNGLVWTVSSSNWCFTNQRNPFLTTPSGQQIAERPSGGSFYTVGDDGTITYLFYVQCPSRETLRGIGIAAQVRNVPDGHNGSKSFDCAGNTSGIDQSIVSLAAKDPVDFSPDQLRTVQRRPIDNHRPPGRDAHDYLDTHTWTVPAGVTAYSIEWSNGSSVGECSNNDYYRSGVSSSWLIYGSVYLPSNAGNGSLSAYTYSRYMGDCLSYNYGGFNGSSYDSFVYFDITVQPNQIVVDKVIGTGFSFINEDWNRQSRSTYVDVVDTVGTRRRLCFAPITTTDESVGPQITSQVIREW